MLKILYSILVIIGITFISLQIEYAYTVFSKSGKNKKRDKVYRIHPAFNDFNNELVKVTISKDQKSYIIDTKPKNKHVASQHLSVPALPNLENLKSDDSHILGISTDGTPLINHKENECRTQFRDTEDQRLTYRGYKLIGIMNDGIFLYGKKCFTHINTLPKDLDSLGGHISVTRHNPLGEYHYHLKYDLHGDHKSCVSKNTKSNNISND